MKDLNGILLYLQRGLYTIVIAGVSACSQINWEPFSNSEMNPQGVSVSEQYNNFEGGVLFRDVRHGLDILWQASFRGSKPYKEHAAFFVEEGILICPNELNTLQSASLSTLPKIIADDKLYVMFEGVYRQVIGIIHTHIAGLPTPAPRNDFQYSHLDLHNYVMSSHDLYDAFWDSYRREVFIRLGNRTAYEKLPFYNSKIQASSRDKR